MLRGEVWTAVSDVVLERDTPIRLLSGDGMTLKVTSLLIRMPEIMFRFLEFFLKLRCLISFVLGELFSNSCLPNAF